MRLGWSTALAYTAGAFLVLFLALFLGLLAASGFYLGQMLAAGLLIGGLLLLLPLPALMVILLVITFFGQGLFTYFLRMQQAAWLPYLLCMLLALKAVRLGTGRASVIQRPRPVWSSPPVLSLLLYLFAMACAIAVNRPPAAQVAIGLKNALPIWTAAALVYQGAGQRGFVPLMWRVMSIVFFLQVPLVLYQHFVIVPRRRDADTTGMDAVVGSFGGLIDAGGANATLVAFALLVMAYQLGLWARGAAPLWRVVLYWLVGLLVIASGEVKAVLVWIPVVILYVLRRRVLASFGAAVVSLAISALLVGGMFAAYSALYWQKISHTSNADLITKMGYFFDPENINYSTGEVSRGASVGLWVQDPAADLPRRLVGYGPGASRISATGGLGEVARRFAPLTIAATALALLLWDSGLLGLLGFLGVIVSCAWLLRRLSNDPALAPSEQAGADAYGAMMIVFLSLTLYNRSLNDEPSLQLILALGLGLTLYWRRQAALHRLHYGPPHPARAA